MKFEENKEYRLKPEYAYKYNTEADRKFLYLLYGLSDLHKAEQGPKFKVKCVRAGQFVEAIEVDGVEYRAKPGMHWLNNSYDPENFEEVGVSFKLPLYCIGQIVNDVIVESDKFEKDLTEMVAREILDIIRKVSDEKYVLIKKV
ncbi:hypothetical protein [Providencia phage PSTRCR_127]|nr:hypothetical protein [Providencia phage PSTRCR_127]